MAPLAGASCVGATGVPPDGGGGEPPPVTVNAAAHEVLSRAKTFACVVDVTDVVVTVKLALIAPSGTMTVAGTTAGLIDDSCTVAPPLGAGALIPTVAVADAPLATVVGSTASEVTQ